MILILCLLLVLVAVGITVMKRLHTKPESRAVISSYAIEMTKDETEAEQRWDEKMLVLLGGRIARSGYFRPEKIPEVMARLRAATVPFGRVNTRAVFGGDPFLTVGEKKALGLNPRMKYSKDFIACFERSTLGSIEPKSTLEHMHLDALHRISREKELRQIREAGFEKIEILTCGGAGDCQHIKHLKKIYTTNDVPELPLSDCDAPFCRCMYISRT